MVGSLKFLKPDIHAVTDCTLESGTEVTLPFLGFLSGVFIITEMKPEQGLSAHTQGMAGSKPHLPLLRLYTEEPQIFGQGTSMRIAPSIKVTLHSQK